MAKIPKWLIDKKELSKEDISQFICKNGSFTCGLLTRLYPLDITRRCRHCRKENLKTSHNNDLKKPCPTCDGKGEVRSATKDIDGYDLEDCHKCKGQGFIKS